MAYKGIDLTHPRWLLAEADRESKLPGNLIPGGGPAEWASEPILKADRGFWAGILQAVAVPGPPARPIPARPVGELVRPLIDAHAATITNLIFNHEELPRLWVALAVPYQAPRPALGQLHRLFQIQAKLAGREVRRDQLSFVEAPIALAIEYAASESVDLASPVRLLLLTGHPPVLELTAATIWQEGRLLKVEATAHAAIDPGDVAGSLGRFEGDDSGPSRLVHAGTPDRAVEVASALAGRSEVEGVHDVGPHGVALGAIRHGGLLMTQPWSLGRPITRVEVRRVVPSSLGVIGTNAAGDAWFWRRLIARGTVLAGEPVSAVLTMNPATVDHLVFAECVAPDLGDRLWLALDEAPPGSIRWHDVVSDVDLPRDGAFQLRMSPADRNRWNPLTACAQWKVAEAPSDDDRARSEQAVEA